MQKTRALLIDDDQRLTALVSEYLQQHDFEVQIAGDGERGLIALERSQFDVILLEYPFAAEAAWTGDPGKHLPKLAGVRKVPVVRADWLADALAPAAALTADVRALAGDMTDA